MVVQEKTPHTGSLSVRTIKQKSLGVGCPLLTLSSQLLLALPAQARLHVGWFEILLLFFLAFHPTSPLVSWSWESEIGPDVVVIFLCLSWGDAIKTKRGSKEKSKSAIYHTEKPSRWSQSFALLLVLEAPCQPPNR